MLPTRGPLLFWTAGASSRLDDGPRNSPKGAILIELPFVPAGLPPEASLWPSEILRGPLLLRGVYCLIVQCKECQTLRFRLIKASVQFAQAEATLKGRVPSVLDETHPFFVARKLRDQAHADLVAHLLEFHED